MSDGYHHGDLPNALRAAAVDVIDEKGVGGFSLREVARRAGVSHAAPAHHFGDMTGLLTSLAIEAMTKLRDTTRAAAATHDDPLEQLEAIGRAYISVGQDHPAHCEIVFRKDLIDADDEDYQHVGLEAFGVLEGVVAAIRDEHNPDLDVTDAARLCWSAMQGLLVLHPSIERMDDLLGRPSRDIGELVAVFTTLLTTGLRGR